MPDAIGQPLTRVDGRLKVTGQAPYTADQNIPNLAHAVLTTSAIAKGRIVSIDTRKAEKVPGVIAVFTHKNKLKVAKDPSTVSPGAPADRALQLLQDDRILYGNQPIAISVAETFEAATEAARLVTAQYAELAPSIRLEQGLPHAYIPKKVGGAGDPGTSSRGEFDAAFPHAGTRMQEIYTTPFQTHSPMEPHATIAVWEGNDKLTLYDTSQGIFGDRKRIAELLGLGAENVRVISLFLGGGFGSKGPCWSHTPLCALAAREVKRPVKLVVRRPQMFGPVGCRSATHQTISIGAGTDGKLSAMKNETISHTSTFDEFTETATLPTRMLYSVPNNSTVQKLIRSDIGTPSYTRAPGEAPGTFALEVAMDELAVKLKMDPLELRLKNYADRDEEKKLPWSGKSLRECYQKGAEKFGWAGRKPEPRSMREGHTLIGWGMATAVYPARRSPASALARLNPDGTFLVEAGSQDVGGGTYTIMTQIAADALRVPVQAVTFKLGDTRYPETPVSGGSQTAATAGTAVREAGEALRQKIFDLTMSDPNFAQSGATVADMRIAGGNVTVRGKSKAIRELVGSQPYIEAQASTKQNEDTKQYSMFSFGAQFAEVRVDADLGQVKVSRMVGAFGAGTILNAKTARSQFMGGMIWGISFALLEHTAYDERLGRIVNNNLAEYHVPTNADVGQIDVLWVEEPDTHVSPMGAKGIGEIGITGSAAAVANAVYHATGKRVRDLPITPEKVL
ncbi:MAG TPA: xanthine dehydrogenase family protein molybdopterin-binding subunit [Bryobacteraceae bacterium]|jgi:xanthine dehydrogenase YagR molybdenum-binding subunit|nr:xanthine dehydrogenase family protein molybdopterin-binding subunit [Bryobacteraceae bacterium]